MSNHTPGPWVIRFGGNPLSDDGFTVASTNAADVRVVAECWPCTCSMEDRKTLAANVRLIAAAPELLEACKAAMADDMNDAARVIAMLEAAIAKAEGTAK